MSHPEHLSASEVAVIIGKSTATVKRLAKAGTLPSFLIGRGKGTYVFNSREVQAYAATRRAELLAAVAKLDEAS